MDGLILWLIGFLVIGISIYGHWLKQRGQPTDQQEGSPPNPPNGSTSLVQSDPDYSRSGWRWYQRLALFVVGAGLGGFVFCFILTGYLSPPKRPVLPDAPLGYTYFFKIKSDGVYGTYFEYLAMTYGPLTTWGVTLVSGIFGASLKINRNSRAYPLQILAGAVISMALYYVIWRVCLYAARS